MCFYHDITSEIWHESTRRARKEYICDECLEKIETGELYVYVRGRCEGIWFVDRECRRCIWDRHRIQRHELKEGCRGMETDPGHGMIWDTLLELGWKQTEKRRVPKRFIPTYWAVVCG